MSEMELNEFLNAEPADREPAIEEPEELDVQKAVVESLAADKAECDEQINRLRKENYALRSEIATLKSKVEEMKMALANVGDVLSKNSESPLSSKVSLLDRNLEVADRFEGETRDQVLEALSVAREQAEKDGRIRCAQLLESVLVENEPSGNLAKKRQALTKYFEQNGNILSGPVITELERCGISHKNGENYLLPAEIIKRTY